MWVSFGHHHRRRVRVRRPRVLPGMRAHVTPYFEAGAGPVIVQNLLRVRYMHDPATFLQIPGHPVLRNFLINLRRKNVVLAHEVAMTGPGCAPASKLPKLMLASVEYPWIPQMNPHSSWVQT